MSTLEEQVRQSLHAAVLERPAALQALSTGEIVHGDLSLLIRDVMLPLLLAQGDALIEAARAIDDLGARLASVEDQAATSLDTPPSQTSQRPRSI